LSQLKVQLVTNLFAPDELAGAALFSDLALYIKEQGTDLRVTTTYSYYPAWKISPEDAPHAFRYEDWNGIPVKRVRMHVPRKPNGVGRMRSDASFLGALVRHGRHDGWTPDVVLTASPMFSQCLAQRFLYAGRGIPRMIVVQDFVVDAALELGILQAPGLQRMLRSLERWSFRSAATLSTISEPMLQKLRGIVGSDRRTVHIPNWIHRSLQQEIDRQAATAPVRSAKALFYSGNLGVKQGLPTFLDDFEAAGTDWQLQINGGGAQADQLAAKIRGQSSAKLGGVLSEAAYVNALLSCAACLVTQAPGVGANFLPSKLLPALATETPVLAVCDETSPLGQEVKAGGFGEVVRPGDASRLKHVLDSWASEPALLRQLGRKASEHAKNFERNRVLARYQEEIGRLVGRR
jgi:colanic acid biosynthesis glycosyl transferase WcaI